MEPVLLYGVPQGCSFGSIVALEWLNQPYRLCRINMPAGHADGSVCADQSCPGNAGDAAGEWRRAHRERGDSAKHRSRGIAQGLGFAQGTLEFDRLNQRLAFLNTTSSRFRAAMACVRDGGEPAGAKHASGTWP